VTAAGQQPVLVVDGVELSRWDRGLFQQLREGGVAAVNATCAFWEDAAETLANIARLHTNLRDHADLVVPVQTAAEIEQAHAEGRVGFLLGFQNASPFEDDLDLVGAFHSLGVRVVQLTYNNQNLVGSGCYEESDSGLSRFGKLVVRELNQLGMLIDLSHVGTETSLDAIGVSEDPVAITHANPRWFHDVPRNKPDQVIRAVAEAGGVVGVCVYQLVLPGGARCTWSQFSQMLLRLLDEIGAEHVAIGTDFTLKQPVELISWLRAGTWTRAPQEPVEPAWPEWLRSPADFPQFVARLRELGIDEPEVRLIMGGNWLRLLRQLEEGG
jgi:microsomal dipeptidase-like Zn-dependent dipeptidase